MRYEIVGVLVASLLVGSTDIRAQAPPPGSGPFDISGFVRVIDGDTVELYIEGHRTGVGIIGIATSMGNTPCGREATNFLRSLIAGGAIRLEEDPTVAFDARKRRMYYAKLADRHLSAAIEMARAGFVKPDGRGNEAEQIAAAAREAAAARRGCVWR
jgi:endonuclease YncB( thermonuclease family)